MRYTKLFGKTLREEPAEAETISHRLMLKAGLIYQVSSGVYSYMPLAWRSLRKIEQIIREEMDAAGGQELRMPVLQPRELWDRSGRSEAFGLNMFNLSDRRERPLVLAPTHEEVIISMVSGFAQSYRDLPLILYQIQTKFRDEARPRGGLIRVREFDMKDAYSFNESGESLDQSYRAMVTAYKNIYSRCGLDAIMVEADSGTIGGKDSHEFILLAESGEDVIVRCPKCDYAANTEKAQSVKPPQDNPDLSGPPLEEVHTPGVKTIQKLADFLDVPRNKTLKAVFYNADGEIVFATIRGDLEVNEVKLRNALYASDLRLAASEEVEAAGLVAGSASPVGLKGIRRIADDSIQLGSNFVIGANQPDYHLRNANYPRDFEVDVITDIALAEAGQACVKCGTPLEAVRGIEVGHVFKLGTRYSEIFEASFLGPDGALKPILMGCYGIGVGRLLAGAIEKSHDDKGIIFPLSMAPYHVNLCALGQDPEVIEAADRFYDDLTKAGIEVLYDDREESAGVKFNDADLLGLPVRAVISKRTLKEASVELKKRDEKEARTVPLNEASETVKEILGIAS